MSVLDSTGLTIDSLNDIITKFEEGYKSIYGNDIILSSDSPDGQRINIEAQAIRDLLEVIAAIYNSFDLNKANGVDLDRLTAILGIERQGATFTQQQIEITVDRSLTLDGLDELATDIDGTGYTVADDTGNEFILLDTANLTAGTHLLTFRAKELGSITTLPNTITNPVTVVLGVTNINNPSGVLELGKDGELDSTYRIRALLSSAIKSIGFTDGLLANILNISGVTDAKVYENFTNATDVNGIPSHSIWAIVEGGANTDIANSIYLKKNSGCGLKGSITLDIIKNNGETFTAKFDRPQSKNLWIRFDLKATKIGVTFDQSNIKQYIVDNLTFNIGEPAETSKITAIAIEAINNEGGGGVPLNIEISDDNITYVDFLDVTTVDEKWIVDLARITISEI